MDNQLVVGLVVCFVISVILWVFAKAQEVEESEAFFTVCLGITCVICLLVFIMRGAAFCSSEKYYNEISQTELTTQETKFGILAYDENSQHVIKDFTKVQQIKNGAKVFSVKYEVRIPFGLDSRGEKYIIKKLEK